MAAGTPALSTKDSVVNNVSPWRRTRRLESWQTIQPGWALALFLYLLLPPPSPAHPTLPRSSPFLPVSASFSLFPEPVAHKLIRSRCPLARDSHWPPQSRRLLCFLCRLCPDPPRRPRPPLFSTTLSISTSPNISQKLLGHRQGESWFINHVNRVANTRLHTRVDHETMSLSMTFLFPRVTSHSYAPSSIRFAALSSLCWAFQLSSFWSVPRYCPAVSQPLFYQPNRDRDFCSTRFDRRIGKTTTCNWTLYTTYRRCTKYRVLREERRLNVSSMSCFAQELFLPLTFRFVQ